MGHKIFEKKVALKYPFDFNVGSSYLTPIKKVCFVVIGKNHVYSNILQIFLYKEILF